MNARDHSKPKPSEGQTGLLFSLRGGLVYACWRGREEILQLAPLDEAQAAMREFQMQTQVGERLGADRDSC